MAVLSGLNTFNNGDVIDAPQMNTNFTQVKNFVDGLSAGTNFAAGAIGSADIASAAITNAKISAGAVGSSNLQSGLSLVTPNIGTATGTSLTCSGTVVDHPSTETTTIPYTLALTDDGNIIEVNSTASVTITVPTFASVAFVAGSKITIIRINTGAVVIEGDTGVTVNSTPGLNLRAQWSVATLICRDSNSWVLTGDISS
jgi:hypothetical protein